MLSKRTFGLSAILCWVLLATTTIFSTLTLPAYAETFREWQSGLTNKEIWDSRAKIPAFADAGDPEAQFVTYIFMGADVYGDWYPLNVARARAYLEASGAAGYRPALATLSANYFWGGGFKGGNEINFFRAADYAELAEKAPYVRPFDDGMTQLLPITYRSLNQGTLKILKPDSDFVNSLEAAVSSEDGEQAYKAGRFLTEFHNEARDAADYFYKIAAARGHVGGILEHAKYVYFGPGLGYEGPTTDSAEARELFEIAAAGGSDQAKEFLSKFKSRARNEAERRQAMLALTTALAAFLTLADEPSVTDSRQREYEATQRRLQYQINTDLALGALVSP